MSLTASLKELKYDEEHQFLFNKTSRHFCEALVADPSKYANLIAGFSSTILSHSIDQNYFISCHTTYSLTPARPSVVCAA